MIWEMFDGYFLRSTAKSIRKEKEKKDKIEWDHLAK